MTQQRMPRADLEPRPGDWPLTGEQVLRLSLFSGLRRKPNLDRFPGAVVLRAFRPGETIYWQGEPGWTAYYVLPSEDVLALRQEQLARGDGDPMRLSAEIGQLRHRLEQVELVAESDWRLVGEVLLAVPRSADARQAGRDRLARASGRALPGTPVRGPDLRTLYVPLDGPATFSYDTLRGPLCEGELIGETSCMYRTPRPATVVVRRECYVLELLRNILDQMSKDAAFREYAEDLHEHRQAARWRKLSLFADLSDAEYEQVRDELRLVRAEPGAIICDEHEHAEAVYVVSSGLVQVARNVSALLDADDICDWPRFWAAWEQGGRSPALTHLWRQLCEQTPAMQDEWDLESPTHRAVLLQACNTVLARPGLADDPAYAGVAAAEALRPRRGERQPGRTGADRDARRRNRLLLEALFPGCIRPLAERGGLDTPLGYRAAGEWFGEFALLANRPQDVTCTACGHPGDEGTIELVRIPAEVFRKLLSTSAALGERVLREAERRQAEERERMRSPLWKDAGPPQAAQAFQELGLIQGQKLMLIDLDRCTRCDECVRACADTHDGLPRLALDGPRLGKYLVPTTCRSCLDPVCLIGCPVGSIHRGPRGQIVIEDWCIGCGLCAENCPYGAIHMQDVGVLPEQSAAWRFLPAEAVATGRWHGRDFRDADWLQGEAPFHYDRDLAERLDSRGGPVLFRCVFQLNPSPHGARFRLEVTSCSPAVSVWVNGVPAEPEDAPRQGRSRYFLAARGDGPRLEAGRNAIAVAVYLPPGCPAGELLLNVRLDEVLRPRVPDAVDRGLAEEVTEKLVTHRAAVCDLCGDLPGSQPACVRVCPHEAALRVDARRAFPRDGA